jgi:hypothetical protein
MEPGMTDPERDHLLHTIHELERRLRRWRLACFLLLAIPALAIALGGLLGLTLVPRWERERAVFEEERERERAVLEGERALARQAMLDAAKAEFKARLEVDRLKDTAEQDGTVAARKSAARPNVPPRGGLTQRQRRVLRSNLTLNTDNGNDYASELKEIKPGGGAILAVPVGDGEYEVIRDLSKRPATGKVEDLATINSFFWVDDKPASVARLAHALQIKVPPYFVAFFSPELEKELARLEKEKAGDVGEDQIEETHFNVVRSADGYRPVVTSVKLKGP